MSAERIEVYEYRPLENKHVVLGVAGSSSLYRSIDLARELRRMGAVVSVVLSRTAAEMVAPRLWRWAVDGDVVAEITGRVEHIGLAESADAMAVAPATLNTMAKIAWGVTDTPVSLTAAALRGAGKPVLIVPAMNINLYASPQRTRVEEMLRSHGYIVIPPLVEEDKAKYPPIRDLAWCVDAAVNRGRDLEGFRVLVTAGPTYEYLDPVRVITNPSTGYMGVAVALELACRGAEVTLVHGPLKIQPPYLVKRIPVTTTLEMANAVKKALGEEKYHAAVFAAAPADYRPGRRYPEKIPTRQGPLDIRLLPTPKVLKLGASRPPVTIGFAAETVRSDEELVERAREKLERYGLTYIVANTVWRNKGFGKTRTNACIVWGDGEECLGEVFKETIARKIGDLLAGALRGGGEEASTGQEEALGEGGETG